MKGLFKVGAVLAILAVLYALLPAKQTLGSEVVPLD